MAFTIEELVVLSLEDNNYSKVLWQRMEPLCLSWAHKLSHIDYDFEELYHESYLILMEALHSYEKEKASKFESYFKLLLYRWGWNYIHKKRDLLVKEEEEQDFWSGVVDFSQQVEENYLHQEAIGILLEGVKSLSKFEYNLLIDVYVKGLKMTQIAKVYELDYKNLEARKRRTLKKLEKFFAAF